MAIGQHGASMNSRSDRIYWIAFFAPVLLLCALFVSVGAERYGDNWNNYGMLNAWQEMIAKGIYVPSRFQGNLPSELLMGYLASAFGPLGSNALSLLLSILSLFLIYIIFLKVESSRIRVALAIATIVANPYWIMAATTSMDYNHPVPLFLGGVSLLLNRTPIGAALLFAVAAGMRISYAPMGAVAIAWALVYSRGCSAYKGPKHKDTNNDSEGNIFPNESKFIFPASSASYLEALLVFFSTVILLYLPVFITSHLTFSFLGSARPVEQGFSGLLVRFGYKSLYLYEILGTVAVAAALFLSRRRLFARRDDLRGSSILLWASIATIAFHLLLFLYIPVRIQYLLPVLFAVAGLLLLGQVKLWVMSLIIAAQLSYCFVSFEVLDIQRRPFSQPCAPIEALGAEIRPHAVPGVLVGEATGETNELLCYPKRLKKQPDRITDPLPVPDRL